MRIFSKLFDEIIIACRDRATKLTSFQNGDGAIRVTFIPQGAPLADLADMPKYADRYEFTARINQQGNYVLNRDDSGKPPVDTYAFSALKNAALLHRYELGVSSCSGRTKNPFICEQNGYAPYRGAVCYDVCMNHRIVGLLIICVSGGTEEEDELAAIAAEPTIKKWCEQSRYDYCLSKPRT